MNTIYNEKQLKEMLRRKIGYKKTQGQLAVELGVSQGFLSDVLCGKRGIGDQIVEKLGFEKVYRLRKK